MMVVARSHQGLKVLVYAVLLLTAIIMLVPLVYLVCAAFKSNQDVYTSSFLPGGDGFLGIDWSRLTTNNFQRLFSELAFARYLLNSVFLASVTSVLATLCSAMGGYALAKFDFRGKSLFSNLVLVTLVMPATLLLAPTYQLLYWLGLLDSYSGLILPAMAPAFGLYLFRQAMLQSVPSEILGAARIDGCSEAQIFFRIVLPLVRPMIGAFLLITFLGTWNNFIGPQIVLQSSEKFPLSVAVAQLKGVYSQDYALQMAGTLVSVAPVLCLFLLLQKEFISGLTSGAVKG
ncbi:MAG: carbohydrate ABC transporter permease [Planctomycetes bacterium]|nr:carbohydrate ABC transporter permease [Planctomycetota bacterium]